jgi:hypothetical protein
MGPVFENVSLGLRVASFAGLTAYGAKAIAAATAIIALEHADVAADKVAEALDPKRYAAKAAKIEKDGDLVGVMQSVIYYVGVAISKTGADGHPMHLPDVAPYWV